MYFKRKTILLALTAILISCVSALYIPTEKDALKQHTSLKTLQQGRELYLNKCAGCHNLYLPSAYTSKEWEPILDKMQKPARIDDSQKEIIAKYLGANSKN